MVAKMIDSATRAGIIVVTNIIFKVPDVLSTEPDSREAYIQRIRKEWADLQEATEGVWDEEEKLPPVDDRH
jgi:hypothetical protein